MQQTEEEARRLLQCDAGETKRTRRPAEKRWWLGQSTQCLRARDSGLVLSRPDKGGTCPQQSPVKLSAGDCQAAGATTTKID